MNRESGLVVLSGGEKGEGGDGMNWIVMGGRGELGEGEGG